MGRIGPLDDDYSQEFRESGGRAVALGLINLVIAAFAASYFVYSPPVDQLGFLVLLMLWGGAFHWLVLARYTRVDATGIRVSRLSGTRTIRWPEIREITEKPGQVMVRNDGTMRVAVVVDRHGYRYVLPHVHDAGERIFDNEISVLRQIWVHRRGANWVDRPVPLRAVGKVAGVVFTVLLGLGGAITALMLRLLAPPELESAAGGLVSLLVLILGGLVGSVLARHLVYHWNHRTPVRSRPVGKQARRQAPPP